MIDRFVERIEIIMEIAKIAGSLVSAATGCVGGQMLAKLLELGAKPVTLVRESSERSKVEVYSSKTTPGTSQITGYSLCTYEET